MRRSPGWLGMLLLMCAPASATTLDEPAWLAVERSSAVAAYRARLDAAVSVRDQGTVVATARSVQTDASLTPAAVPRERAVEAAAMTRALQSADLRSLPGDGALLARLALRAPEGVALEAVEALAMSRRSWR